MKKSVAFLLALALFGSLTACGKEEAPEAAEAIPLLTEAPVLTEAPTTVPTTEATTAPTLESTVSTTETAAVEEELQAAAAPEGPGISAAITGADTVNVRSGPSGNTKVVKKLNKGDRIMIYEAVKMEKTVWGRMDEGWISMQFVELDGDVPQNDPDKGLPALVVGTEKVNIRTEPDVGSEKAAELHRYDCVRIYETLEHDNAVWARIDQGWVSMQYLKNAEPAYPAPQEVSEEAGEATDAALADVEGSQQETGSSNSPGTSATPAEDSDFK